ncbi:hypothetical protein BH18THE2_BH18THE2_14620 [soil metagenome]
MTKWANNTDEGRRRRYLEHMADLPISLDADRFEEPKAKGLISTKSDGPITEPAVSYSPEPGEVPNNNPATNIPSGLDVIQNANPRIRITSEVITDGAGRTIKSNRWS